VNHDNQQAWLDALRWVMTQPGLLEGLPGGHEPLLHPDDPRLDALLAVDTVGLMELLAAPRAHKLGIAFEALMLWGLEQGLGYRCIVRDVQIQDGKRTMGALDFILEAPDGTHEHWELAYKLFLQCDGGSEWSSWLGPRGRDRLDAKLNRMLTHQLPLSSTPQAVATLNALGVNHIERRRLMVQGVLFSPWGDKPQRATQGHQTAQGRWLRPSQIPALVTAHPNSRWVYRERPLWFGPWHGPEDAAVRSEVLAQTVGTKPLEYAQLWSRLNGPEHDQETLFFVVPENWAE
jgi:hypothetical protein